MYETSKGSTEGTGQITQLIIDTLSRILYVQSMVVEKEFKISILKRGLVNDTIIERDLNIQNIVTNLLNNPYHDRDTVFSFQHFMYKSKLEIELKIITL